MKPVFGVDENIQSAVANWIDYGLDPGSCTLLMLSGRWKEAKLHAHPGILSYWKEHKAYIKSIPKRYRGKNMRTHKESFSDGV